MGSDARRFMAETKGAGMQEITMNEKADVFDALVAEFQGKGRLSHYHRETVEVKTGPHETEIRVKDVPVYEWRLNIKGHDDFTAGIMAMLTPNAIELTGAPETKER